MSQSPLQVCFFLFFLLSSFVLVTMYVSEFVPSFVPEFAPSLNIYMKRTEKQEEPGIELKQYTRLESPALFPTRAFMVTTIAAQASGKTAHAVAQAKRMGVRSVEFVFGTNPPDEEFGCQSENNFSPTGCRIGLSLAHKEMWERVVAEGLSSALLLEDDILVHDNFSSLLPLYWKHVPPDFEVVYLGCYPNWLSDWRMKPPGQMVLVGESVWTLHAYIVTAASALRFSSLFQQMFRERGKSVAHATPLLTWRDALSDFFMRNHAFRTSFDSSKWVNFLSTHEIPSSFNGIKFVDNRKAWQEGSLLRFCQCDESYRPECRGFLPIHSTGLVFQQIHCSNTSNFYMWLQHFQEDLPDLVQDPHWVF